jgi:hypothetical protein
MKNMKNIKPTSLKGREVLDRMKNLMGDTTPVNENKHNFKIERTKLGPDNVVYGIVREGHEFYIKTANKVKNLMLEDFQYIGGLKNKKKHAYKSYSAAMKKLNLKMISLNEQFGGDKVDIFTNDNLLNENFGEEDVDNDFIEEEVSQCSCGKNPGGPCPDGECPLQENGMKTEGELKSSDLNVFQDGPKELPSNAIGKHKDVTAEPDDAVNDKSTGTESEGQKKATPKKTIGEGKSKCGFSILKAMEKMDRIIESIDVEKNSLDEVEMDSADVRTMSQKYEENLKAKVQPITTQYVGPMGGNDNTIELTPRVSHVANANYDKSSVGLSDGSTTVEWKFRRAHYYVDISAYSGGMTVTIELGSGDILSQESLHHVVMIAETIAEMHQIHGFDVMRLVSAIKDEARTSISFGTQSESLKKKDLTEAKYKLKVDNPTPKSEPSFDSKGGDSFDEDFGDEDFGDFPDEEGFDAPEPKHTESESPFRDEPFDAGVEADEDQDPKKFLEQLSGKIGQSLRQYVDEHGIDFELEKFILNSIISATHTAQMPEDDKDDIITKINTSGDGGEDENDSEEPSVDQPPATGENPTNPAPAGDGGAPMGEGIEILPKEHKQVFKNAKLGVNESFGEGFGEGTYEPQLVDETEDDTIVYDDEDWEKIGREVEYNQNTNDYISEDEEGKEEEDLEVNDKMDSFDDKTMKQMILDYLMNSSGTEVAPEPVKEPEVKPAPTKKPRRESPYRIKRPLPNPTPKATNE